MYEAFYGLTSKPFQLNPDPAFYFDSKQHRRAKAYLEYGVARNEGFIVVTGEIGAGKTTMLAGLLGSLNNSNVNVGQLVTTQLDAEDTLRMVSAAFGFNVIGVPKSQLLITLEAYFIGQASQGMRSLLIVDEAQNLSPRAVEELRMLSNYQLGTQALLQSFLVGQPEFKRILQRPEMEQLRQRVAATCHIGPMDQEDTQQYIAHRLKCAGATDRPVFEPGVTEAIFKASQGIPRRINLLCDRLLLLGFLGNKTAFDVSDVNAVVSEFASEAWAPSEPARATKNGTPVLPEVDVSKFKLEPGAIDEVSQHMSSLAAQHEGDRLQRLERSMLRLERINLETLTTLQTLLNAVRKSSNGSGR